MNNDSYNLFVIKTVIIIIIGYSLYYDIKLNKY